MKPRTRQAKHYPVIAISAGEILTEAGETLPVESLETELPDYRSTLFVALGAADLVSKLDKIWSEKDSKYWQWRAAVHQRDIVRPDGVRVAAQVSTLIHYFGFKGHAFHKIIDPVVMYGRKLDEILPGNDTRIIKLLRWGITIRDFCAENNLEVRPTAGGIASQFLTDPRFYPEPRRKVPRKTNDNAREQMPGNYYFLNVNPLPSNNFTAYYLDQHNAHHYHAQHTALPDANYLYAYGRFMDLGAIVFSKPLPTFHGLYCLDMEIPHAPFLWLRRGTGKQIFVHSNELPHLYDVGIRITGIRAAWGSIRADTGLALYAKWAEQELDRYQNPPWLKPLLLSAYGSLATKPTYGESLFRLAKSGEEMTIRTGHHSLTGKLNKRPQKLEPGIANVLHRGMIEAATRSESVGLAQWLQNIGQRVLHIYADGVIVQVDDDNPLPALPEPWRCKQQLNHLQFVNQQAFMSDGMTRLPGVSREAIAYRQHRKPGHAPRVTDVLGIPTPNRI